MGQPEIKSWIMYELHKTLLKTIHTLKANGQDLEILKISESSETHYVLTPKLGRGGGGGGGGYKVNLVG